MQRMRAGALTVRDWLRQAPRWTAILLGGLIAADVAQFVLQMRAHADSGPARISASRSSSSGPGLEQLLNAHLFGVEPAAALPGASDAAAAHLALSGVVATGDPNEGYAILGEQGKSTHLYRAGAALAGSGDDRLYQVFADHVVLALGGRLQTLTLPLNLSRSGTAQADTQAQAQALAETARIAAALPSNNDPPTATQSWFSNLLAERYNVDGKLAGMLLHPAKHFQRRYGLRDGDTLTAVNGVAITDEETLDKALKTNSTTVALTVVREGVPATLRFPVNE
jgi:type II secretion system protein C